MEHSRALIIVDALDIVSLDFRQTLDNAGYATELVLDNQVALDQIIQIKPDVIFLHLDLPTVYGTHLYQTLQNDERLKGIPMVAIAAYAEVANKLYSVADVVLVRPVNHERLTNLLSLLCSIDKPMDQTPWDALTGFYTPSFFIARLNQTIEKSDQIDSIDFIVFSINLDQLMKYEKKFGKEYRQQILQGTAKVLKKVLRPTDLVSRFDSDQYLVLVENAVDRYAPISIADRMQFEFDEFLISSGLKHRIKIEIGILSCDGSYETADEVMRAAQLAIQAGWVGTHNGFKVRQRASTKANNYFLGNKSLFSA
ncbi:MAG: diguanylate cyclase [Anaerolineales bacterium]